MVEKDDKFDLILTILEQIQEKLNNLNVKSSEEKGSEVGSARQTEKDECGHESHFINSKSECPTCKDLEGEKTTRKYKISGKPCNKCEGLISWDEFDTKTHTGRPIHVDGEGHKLGTGACPNWRD